MSPKLIVIGDSCLINYPQGGGLWILLLHYLLGLKALGHKIYFFEGSASSGNADEDEGKVKLFFERLKQYGLENEGVVLFFDKGITGHDIHYATTYGKNKKEVSDIIAGADSFWNICCAYKQPFVSLFKHSVLVDLDPGHLQVSALDMEMGIHQHDSHLTIGSKINDPDCEIPTLNLHWKTFSPFVYLPLWQSTTDDNIGRPFTTITHWNWDELDWDGRRLSLSKREAYMRYINLPKLVDYPFELAAYLEPDDPTGDGELIQANGWKITDPWVATNSPKEYQDYIRNSRAEILCPKPIFRELNTGWISDRSICYLASGRPVLAEETGFSDRLPTGHGLLAFRNIEEAVEGFKEIEKDYKHHQQAARKLAESLFDSNSCLSQMLEQSM